jgi:S1-C subfamily serine protease
VAIITNTEMIKRITTLLALALVVVTTFGQTLDGFKYVYVPTITYQNGGVDIWGISSILRTSFANKGFVVISESSIPPKELEQDPCLMLRCFIDHTNVLSGTNEVIITLMNCKNEVVHTNTGGAMGWSLQDDYNKATKRAFSQINLMNYSYKSSKTPQFEFPEVEKLAETEESIKEYLSTNKLDALEGIYKSYQTEGMPYYKFGIIKQSDKYKAIILESDLKHWKVGEVKAVFEESSMKGFFSVKWYMGNKNSFETFASMDNEALLSIELKDQKTGEKRQDRFIKMFPATSNDVTSNKDNSIASGSGFFLTTNGIIATNAHVVEGSSKIEITVSNEVGVFTYNTKVLLVDSKNDVALLQIDDDKFKGFSKIPYGVTENSDVGSKVFTIGYPLNDVMGTNFKVTDGIISAISGISDDVRYYQISVPIQPGNSGGPLFNKEGNIIGITSATLNEKAVGTRVENVNYAIKSSYLLNLYNMLPNSTKLSSTSVVESKELQEQVKILKNYVCLIKVF